MPGRGKPRTDIRRLRSQKRKAEQESQGQEIDHGSQGKKVATSTQTQTVGQVQTRAREPLEIVSLCGDGDASAHKGRSRSLYEKNAVDFDKIFKPIDFADTNNDTLEIDQFRCGGDALALHVPQQIKEKIWRNEYVDLGLLLKGNIELDDICTGGLIQLNEAGVLETKPKSSNQSVATINEWTDAFIIFCSIYWLKYPNSAQDMLKYISIIREAGGRFSVAGWRAYDQQFRLRQSNTFTRQSWGSINSELWVRLMTPQPAYLTNHVPSSKPTYDKLHPAMELTCNDFNRSFCSRALCKFKHACSICRSMLHSKARCPTLMGAGSNSPFQIRQANYRGRQFHRGGVRGRSFGRPGRHFRY